MITGPVACVGLCHFALDPKAWSWTSSSHQTKKIKPSVRKPSGKSFPIKQGTPGACGC